MQDTYKDDLGDVTFTRGNKECGCILGREEVMRRKYKLDEYDLNIIFKALIEFRNQFIAEGEFTDAVDELLTKLAG